MEQQQQQRKKIRINVIKVIWNATKYNRLENRNDIFDWLFE